MHTSKVGVQFGFVSQAFVIYPIAIPGGEPDPTGEDPCRSIAFPADMQAYTASSSVVQLLGPKAR